MEPNQFVTFIQMLESIRCMIGAVGANDNTRKGNMDLSDKLAEEARNNAQYQAHKAHRITTEDQRRA